MAASGELKVFGIRHHGPGSARSLLRALEDFRPDAVLIEGPPDADGILPLAAEAGMEPPVAILVHEEADPAKAAFWPFAAFSPEWSALRWALGNGAAVKFMDLPFAHRAPDGEDRREPGRGRDPLSELAAAAGFSDGERWWDAVVERSGGDAAAFAAIAEAMRALREVQELEDAVGALEADRLLEEARKAAVAAGLPVVEPGPSHEERREAWMRRTIAEARKTHGRVAVVCGAWHVPAIEGGKAKPGDRAVLSGLPRRKTVAAWVPWTHGRLAAASGYGAGVEAPGWYAHLWEAAARGDGPERTISSWMAKVSHLLRGEGLDASAASVVEAVRLADALAALRLAPLPGLAETEEAIRTVLTHGEDAPLALVRRRLIVGEAIGAVPDGAPRTPLQHDVEAEAKRLHLKRSPEAQDLELDLREANGLARSIFLHRLALLGVAWGQLREVSGRGTFKEAWHLKWDPGFEVELAVASRYGNTLDAAAAGRTAERAAAETTVSGLARILDAAIIADLPDAAADLMARLEREAAAGGDAAEVMAALPPAAQALRYGTVRRFDAALLGRVVEGMAARAAAAVGALCRGIADDEAEKIAGLLAGTTDTLVMLDRADVLELWLRALEEVADLDLTHGLLAGLAARTLMDRQVRDAERTAATMAGALAPTIDAARSGAWALGFLRAGAAALIHGDALWRVLDDWVRRLDADAFQAVLPLLRRAFAPLEPGERRQIGLKARGGAAAARPARTTADALPANFDAATAALAARTAARLLGLPNLDAA